MVHRFYNHALLCNTGVNIIILVVHLYNTAGKVPGGLVCILPMRNLEEGVV